MIFQAGDEYASDFVVLQPEQLVEDERNSSKYFTLNMELTDDGDNVQIYYAPPDFSTWERLDADISGGHATVRAQKGGVFVARTESNVGMIVGIVVACAVVVVIVGGTMFYFRRNPTKWEAVRTNCRNARTGMKSRV